MIRNIIFDWSGTLVDDLPAVWTATNDVFKKAGLDPWTLERFRAEFRLPFTDFYNRVTPQIPIDQLEVWFHESFRQARDSVRDHPHAREFLEFCRDRRLRCFVLSTVTVDHFTHQTARNGFGQFIERPYLGVLDKRSKILDILAENQLAPEETLFIGDMEHDVETARHGRVHSCAVLTGYSLLPDLRRSMPDLIVEHLGELRHLLEKHALSWPIPKAGSLAEVAFPIATVGALIQDSPQLPMPHTGTDAPGTLE